jgi:uncharacterized protein (TIGR02466 family)
MQDIKIEGVGAVFPVFPIPIAKYTDTNFHDIKDEFVEMCYSEMNSKDRGRVISNRGGGWQSDESWFYEEENKSFNLYLHKIVERLFYDVFDHAGELSFTMGAWININPPGAYNVSHTHPGCDYAGVFYINVPDDESPLVFDGPQSHEHHNTFSMYSENFKHQYGIFPEIEMHPNEGMIAIFPSSIRHFVDDNRSDEDRISIAFNINITNYGKFAVNNRRGKIKC